MTIGRMAARSAGIHFTMSLRAGSPPPVLRGIDDLGTVHAIDGDGSALCAATMRVEPVDVLQWVDVPAGQQCPLCQAVLGPTPRRNAAH
jgi:hypothetical protein